jgi:hypothetical protein
MIRKFLLALLAIATPVAAPSVAYAQLPAPMSDERFWGIIDDAGPKASNTNPLLANLERTLEALPVEELLPFQAALDRKMDQAYRWDLWGAAFVIHGGASDDGFEYFRFWLISRGRTVYESALADPDSLADLIPEDAGGPLELEGLGQITFEIWSRRTGNNNLHLPRPVGNQSEPSGEPFKEDEADLARRYPKLWARFGHSPLG